MDRAIKNLEISKKIDSIIPDTGLVDLGQISKEDMKIINRAIRIGIVIKLPCFDFPIRKNSYYKVNTVHPTFLKIFGIDKQSKA